MNHNDATSLSKLAADVLEVILKPDEFSNDGDYPDYAIGQDTKGELYLEMRLRYKLDPRKRAISPRDFGDGFAKFLRPISEKITAGEVGELRREKKRLEDVVINLNKRIELLQRYEDVVKIQQGKAL